MAGRCVDETAGEPSVSGSERDRAGEHERSCAFDDRADRTAGTHRSDRFDVLVDHVVDDHLDIGFVAEQVEPSGAVEVTEQSGSEVGLG